MALNRVFIALVLVLVVAAAVYATYNYGRPGAVLKVFCAGSLKIPIERLAKIFRDRYGVDVHVESSGSVEAVRKVIDLGRPCDVLALADYRLIPKYLYPNYSDWYVAFAGNEVVLAFTSRSRYSSEVVKDPSRWFEVLGKPGVRWGFSDPNKDPCGYRAVGVIALASIYYGRSDILRDLLLSRTNMRAGVRGDNLVIYVPSNLEVRSTDLVVRPMSVELISLLESGSIDYAFEYLSVAKQHNLSYVRLPREVNLGDPGLKGFYSKVAVNILTGSSRERAIRMAPIVYGATVPKVSEHPDLGIKFVELMLSDTGREVFRELGQPPLTRPVYSGNIPKELVVEGGG